MSLLSVYSFMARSFSQVIADGQFAVLGVTLLAEVANIQTILKSISEAEDMVGGQNNEVVDSQSISVSNEWEDMGHLLQRPLSPSTPSDPSGQYHARGCRAPEIRSERQKSISSTVKSRHKQSNVALDSTIDQIFGLLG